MTWTPVLTICGVLGPLLAEVPLSQISNYKNALMVKTGTSAAPVTFRDLWDHPDEHMGRHVRVEGKWERAFHGAATVGLPERREVWISSGSRDLLCLVHPFEKSRETLPQSHERISFAGTFLGLIRYESSDVTRLAPLIVGSERPQRLQEVRGTAQKDTSAEWLLAAACLGFVILMLGRVAARRPPSRKPLSFEPVDFES